MIHITQAGYPNLYKATILCMLDNGMINRLEPKPDNVATEFSEETLKKAELELVGFTEAQMDTFANGEYTEVCELVDRLGALTADYVLQEIVG
jgi:hypothetical protein